MRNLPAARAAVALVAYASSLQAQNGATESSAMFRGGTTRTGVYDHGVSGGALLGVQWRFVTGGM